VAYKHDQEARQEAAAHQVSGDGVAQLQGQCARKAAELGEGGVRGHRVSFSPEAWEKPRGLPGGVRRAGSICRGEVMDIGERVRDGTLPATALFAASFVWGWGTTGYGPRRYRDICAAAGSHLELSLQCVLAVIGNDRGAPDVIAGYAQFYGGYDYENRGAPGQEPWSRLWGFGPAFFTKFLYFSTPGALILDNRLANAVHSLSGLPHLVTEKGHSVAWTPYRYAVYLHWMRQTADAVGVEPEILEPALFQPAEDFSDDHDAAD